jgi:hypothetical protein
MTAFCWLLGHEWGFIKHGPFRRPACIHCGRLQ